MENFTGNENKAFLWSFLNEQNLFEGINAKFKDEIKSIFEKTIEYVSRQQKIITLSDKNKESIRIMVGKLSEYRQLSQIQQSGQSNNQPIQQQNMLRNKGIYNSNDIQQDRQQRFDSDFQRKKKEFDAISPKKPDTIDFTDKNIDSPIGEENIDSLIAKTIAMREQQLNQIMEFQEPTKAAEWIGTTVNSSNVTNNNNVVNLKIGKETPLPDKHIVDLDSINSKSKVSPINKQVSFSDNNQVYTFSDVNETVNHELSNKTDNQSVFSANNISSFFNKLKKNDKPQIEFHENSQPQHQHQHQHQDQDQRVNKVKDIYNDENININRKLDLLNEKLDKLLEQQTIILSKLNETNK